MEEFKDLTLVCADGTVKASGYVITSLAKVEILKESLLLDHGNLQLPFGAEEVQLAVDCTHAGLKFVEEHLPTHNLETMHKVACVFDFLHAQDELDMVLDAMMPAFQAATLRAMVSVGDMMFKHSCQYFWDEVARTFFTAAPFWSTFESEVLAKIQLDIKLARRIVNTLGQAFSPTWILLAMIKQLETSLGPEEALELLACPWGDSCHPFEVGDVLTTMIKTLSRREHTGNKLMAALVNMRDAVTPELYTPMRTPLATLIGSVVLYNNSPKLSIMVDAYGVRRGAARRRVTKGVVMVLDVDSVVIEVDLLKLGCGRPRELAARMALVDKGECMAEEWFYLHTDPPNGRTYKFESGLGASPTPTAETDFRAVTIARTAALYPGGFWVRFDAFYSTAAFVCKTVKALVREQPQASTV